MPGMVGSCGGGSRYRGDHSPSCVGVKKTCRHHIQSLPSVSYVPPYVPQLVRRRKDRFCVIMAVQAAPPQQQELEQAEEDEQFGPQPVSKLEVRQFPRCTSLSKPTRPVTCVIHAHARSEIPPSPRAENEGKIDFVSSWPYRQLRINC